MVGETPFMQLCGCEDYLLGRHRAKSAARVPNSRKLRKQLPASTSEP